MTRSFLQIMRDALIARKAGVSAAVALMAACRDDDRAWNTLFDRLMKAAELEGSIKRRQRISARAR